MNFSVTCGPGGGGAWGSEHVCEGTLFCSGNVPQDQVAPDPVQPTLFKKDLGDFQTSMVIYEP